MDNLDFSEEEIQEQLEILGYKNIPKHRLHEFKQDLDELIRHGKWKSLTSSHHVNSTKSQTAAFQPSPPAFTKEKVSRCNADDFEGFFLHAGKVDHDRQVLTTSQNKDNGWRKDHCDSYAQHSVALRLRLPSGAPNALQVESDPEDTLHPPHVDSCASTPDTLERRFIKRKVLRKHKGRSLVCDESVYSEDSALRIHRPHTSARVQVATMYKMYNSQWDQDSDDDDKNSLNSSFWSDGERQEDEKEEEEEEEVEVERVIEEENSKPAAQVEDSLLEASEEEKPELNHQGDDSTESSEDGEEGSDADEGCSSSGDSPVPSLMTSGYGTYRPEEQEGGDYRDDHTITEFDQDSRGDLSEMRDDEEDDRSLSSFGGFDIEPMHEPDYGETRPSSVFEDGEANVLCCGDDGPCEETDITHMKPEEVESKADELKFENELPDDLDAESDNEDVTCERSERQQHGISVAEDEFFQDGKKVEGLTDLEEGEEYERLEADVQDLNVESNVERDVEDKVESEDPDESSSNKDIKFIDSKVDSSWKTYVEWEGNLRHKKDAASSLEERLAELQLSARQDSETENQDVTGQSDTRDSESEEISMSAFESYIRGMTQTHSDGDLRPKPKSFIRPVMNQQTIKKTDPVAKYFQYKQLWEMFKLPGEKDRRALRSEIKERLAYQPPPPKPRRVYVRNTYTVPTEKKRSALRWEIRNDLANGLLPYKYSYRF